MKTAVQIFFDMWLTEMERAYQNLSAAEFTELEDKMLHEINFHRRPTRPPRPSSPVRKPVHPTRPRLGGLGWSKPWE